LTARARIKLADFAVTVKPCKSSPDPILSRVSFWFWIASRKLVSGGVCKDGWRSGPPETQNRI